MALARTNFPGFIISGGSILPGCYQGRDVSILDVYDVQAEADAGVTTQAEAEEIRRVACPGPGGCGIAASFNTWGLSFWNLARCDWHSLQPEAVVGGPIALVLDGDEISFDLPLGEVTWHVNDDEHARRRALWNPPTLQYQRHFIADFAATVTQAHEGCVSRSVLMARR